MMKFALPIFCLLWSLSTLHADFVTETIDQINVERQKSGLQTLTDDPTLDSIAQEWAEKLADQQFLQHRSTGGLKEFLIRYGWRGMNENLHRSTAPVTPAFVVKCWMDSPVHHENLLRAKITKVGIGVKTGTDGLTYVVFNGAF